MTMTRPLKILCTDDPPRFQAGVTLVVDRAFLGCLVFPKVKVRREVRRELAVIERFALQAGLRLGEFGARDIQEITSVPEHAAHRFLQRLVRAKALLQRDEDRYEIRREAAELALVEAVTREEVVAEQDFLWLPRSDDWIAFPERDESFQRLVSLQPIGKAPVPREHRGISFAQRLESSIQQKEVWGLPENVVGVAAKPEDEEARLPEVCPAFFCEGKLHDGNGAGELRLCLEGQPGKRDRSAPRVWTSFPTTTRLCQDWRALAEAPAREEYLDAVASAAGLHRDEIGEVRRSVPSEYVLAIQIGAARRLFADRVPLLEEFGLQVCSPEETSVAVRVRLEPAAPALAAPFAIDAAVVDVLSNARDLPLAEAIEAAIIRARATYSLAAHAAKSVDAGSVLDRLWSLQHYAFIYRTRAETDFPYDGAH